MKKHNFSSGPAVLPQTVFEQAAQAVLDFENSGLSILEISHRSKLFVRVLDEAEALVRELLHADQRYEVLFLTGGASAQFFMVPMNLLNDHESAAYIDTGTWSEKALKEARAFGNITEAASAKADGYTHIPQHYNLPNPCKYLHITTNNTVYGAQYHTYPQVGVPLVGDMSSDIFSRPLDITPFGLLYAGAQKNIGSAGVTLVVVRKEMLGTVSRRLPTMLDYRVHARAQSSYNTPPVFAIYVTMLNLRWIKAMGGLAAMQARNEAKAKLFYNTLDSSRAFFGKVRTQDRSLMNATFFAKSDRIAMQFLHQCDQVGISTIKGHRTVGGFRASMYNALELESVQTLVQVMEAMNEYADE